ncbi:MAG TPA: hypothetical protein VF297_16505 [Pyrinomonadaceae bacterium]
MLPLALALVGVSAFSTSLVPSVSAQEAKPAPTPKPSKVFQEARAVNAGAAPEAQAFEFEMNGFAYHVSANGNGRRTKGKRVRGFNLRLDSGESIARALYHEYEGDLLFILHTNIGAAAVGFITRLEQPSMRGLWRHRIPAPDVGHPLRDGVYLYVTGKGFVGKLDLRSGMYLWQSDDRDYADRDTVKALGAFDEPELDGDAVLFRERPVYNPRRTLVVDRKSGRVIRVE